MKVSGAQALFKALEGEGVDIVLDPRRRDPARLRPADRVGCPPRAVPARAGSRARREGYAWATGRWASRSPRRVRVAATSWTALADAKMDSVPIVAITGQVPMPAVGNDAFQEADITGITMPVTKHNFLVTDPGEVAETIREAFHIARTGRPGPVLVDLPKDVLVNETTWSWPIRSICRATAPRPRATCARWWRRRS